MTRTHIKTVSIAADHAKPLFSKGQKAFNKLIKQIEQKRAQLAAWEAATGYVGENRSFSITRS